MSFVLDTFKILFKNVVNPYKIRVKRMLEQCFQIDYKTYLKIILIVIYYLKVVISKILE